MRAAALAALLLLPLPAHAHALFDHRSGGQPAAGGEGAAAQAPAVEAALEAAPAGTEAGLALRGLFARRLTWEGPRVTVCFWNGVQRLQEQVLEIAREWTRGRALSLDAGPGPAPARCDEGNWRRHDVRVSLRPDPALVNAAVDDPHGHWSVIGRASRDDRTRRATLNLPFSPSAREAEIREYALHEFGHALGFLHEHQRAECGAELDREAVKQALGWNDSLYETNLAAIPGSDAYYRPRPVGAFDRESVMLYSMAAHWFRDPATARCLRPNRVSALSAGDREAMAAAYPAASGPAPPAPVPPGPAVTPRPAAPSWPEAVSGAGLPSTLRDLLARPAALEAEASALREAATRLRAREAGDDGLRSLAGAPLSAEAAALEARAGAAAEQAGRWRLSPEAVTRAERAFRLLGAP